MTERTTSSEKSLLKKSTVRALTVAMVSMAVGVLFFRHNVFIQTMRASQFLTSGVTAALFYAALKSSRLRDGLAALLVWYIVCTLLLVEPNSWVFILDGVYVVGIALTVYVVDLAVSKNIVRGLLQHLAAMGVLTGLANGLIVIVLSLISFGTSIFSYGRVLGIAFANLQLGTVIGIGLGLGMELSEFLLRQPSMQKLLAIELEPTDGVGGSAEGKPESPSREDG